jgi:hypothetical protein
MISPTTAHQDISYSSTSRYLLQQHIKISPTAAHQDISYSSTSRYLLQQHIKISPTAAHHLLNKKLLDFFCTFKLLPAKEELSFCKRINEIFIKNVFKKCVS